MKSLGQVEREAVMTYVTTRWTRAKLAAFGTAPTVPDPGHDEDQICPILYFGQPFDPGKEGDLAALSSYAVRELRGYGLYLLAIQDGTWAGQELPLNLVGGSWILTAPDPDGETVVFPGSDPVDGATITFTLEDESTFTADVTATWLHGVGFIALNLSEIGAVKLEQGSRAPYEARVRLNVWIAAPPTNAPQVADQYLGAIAALLRRVKLRGDSGAAPGTVERDMADAGLHYIFQRDMEPVAERPSHLKDQDGWQWFYGSVVLRRLYTAEPAGLQAVAG